MADWAEELARKAAHSFPPSDFGSHRAIQAVAKLLRAERTRCAEIASGRAVACREAVERYQHQYPAEPQWAASERCAEREALHIASRIRTGEAAS